MSTDDTYIIFIDGLEVQYQETSDADSRILTIQFQEGDSDIEIIGTQVIPEFGPIVMIILVVAIASVIISTKKTILQSS
jgi:predicted secreted protein with PEFG-CTERM motif